MANATLWWSYRKPSCDQDRVWALKGPDTPSFRKRHPRFAVLAQTRMQELNWKVYVRALAGCGALVVLSVSRLPCLERRAPGDRTEDKAATWVNAAKAANLCECRTCAGKVRADIHKDVQRPYICTVGSSAIERFCLGHSRHDERWLLHRICRLERNTSMRWLAV